jgi:hypothetical protein
VKTRAETFKTKNPKDSGNENAEGNQKSQLEEQNEKRTRQDCGIQDILRWIRARQRHWRDHMERTGLIERKIDKVG